MEVILKGNNGKLETVGAAKIGIEISVVRGPISDGDIVVEKLNVGQVFELVDEIDHRTFRNGSRIFNTPGTYKVTVAQKPIEIKVIFH